MLLRRLTLCFGLVLGFVSPSDAARDAKSPNFWIETTGLGDLSAGGDRAVARRQAVADALLNATLAGGAELRGHTVLDQARITADRMIIRPTARVLRFHIKSEKVQDGFYHVRLRALVGNVPMGACSVKRVLAITGVPPRITVSPHAPPWADALAHEIAQFMFRALEDHPQVDLMQISQRRYVKRGQSRGYEFDYDAVTRGMTQLGGGDHLFRPTIHINVDRRLGRLQQVGLEMRLVIEDGTGQTVSHLVESSVDWAKTSTMASLTGFARGAAKDTLLRKTMYGVRAIIDGQTCLPPSATARVDGKQLVVPIGRRHGLSRASLGFVSAMDNKPALLEISELGARYAILRPLDPRFTIDDFEGLALQFWETGL